MIYNEYYGKKPASSYNLNIKTSNVQELLRKIVFSFALHLCNAPMNSVSIVADLNTYFLQSGKIKFY